jgi:hypothetical protein
MQNERSLFEFSIKVLSKSQTMTLCSSGNIHHTIFHWHIVIFFQKVFKYVSIICCRCKLITTKAQHKQARKKERMRWSALEKIKQQEEISNNNNNNHNHNILTYLSDHPAVLTKSNPVVLECVNRVELKKQAARFIRR